MQYAAQRTPISAPQALGILQAALPPGTSARALAIVAAQSDVETAAWAAMWLWNFGNITAVSGQDYQILPGLTGSFRAYAAPIDGAADYVRWLSTRGVLPYALTGDVAGYVGALRAGCYLGCIGQTDQRGHTVSQSDYDAYQSAISARMARYETMVPIPYSAGLSVGQALLAGASLLAIGGAVAYFISDGELPRLPKVPKLIKRLSFR